MGTTFGSLGRQPSPASSLDAGDIVLIRRPMATPMGPLPPDLARGVASTHKRNFFSVQRQSLSCAFLLELPQLQCELCAIRCGMCAAVLLPLLVTTTTTTSNGCPFLSRAGPCHRLCVLFWPRAVWTHVAIVLRHRNTVWLCEPTVRGLELNPCIPRLRALESIGAKVCGNFRRNMDFWS